MPIIVIDDGRRPKEIGLTESEIFVLDRARENCHVFQIAGQGKVIVEDIDEEGKPNVTKHLERTVTKLVECGLLEEFAVDWGAHRYWRPTALGRTARDQESAMRCFLGGGKDERKPVGE